MFIITFLSNSLNLTLGLVFVMGLATSGTTTVGFVYGQEFFSTRWKIIYGTSFLVLESLIVILLACYFDFISNNYIYITGLGIGLEVFATIMTLF